MDALQLVGLWRERERGRKRGIRRERLGPRPGETHLIFSNDMLVCGEFAFFHELCVLKLQSLKQFIET